MATAQKTMIEKRPTLRFFEFHNDWEERHLREIFINSRSKGNDSLPIYSVTINSGLVRRDSLDRNIENASNPEDNLYVEKGDLVYNMMRMWQGAVGIADRECMVSPAYVVLKPRENIYSPFFLKYFARKRSHYLFESFSYGITSDRLRLYYKDFGQIKFCVPSFAEQEKISTFLSSVDTWIENLQQQKEKLEAYKKGVMQKIFSQEMRFKDENGKNFPEWEEAPFSQIAKRSTTKFNPSSGKTIKCIELESIEQNTGKILKIFDAKDLKSIKNQFKKNSVLFGKLRPNLRKFAKPDFDGVCTSEIWVLEGLKVSNDFLYLIIQTTKFQEIANTTFGSKMPRADWNYIANFYFSFPSLVEQKKIVTFLTAIDANLDIKQMQIEKAKEWKKGLMQQLFI